MKKFFQGLGQFFRRIFDWCGKHKTIVALVVTGLFVLSQVPFLVNHEIWSDEAVPWEISKQITPSNIYELNDAEPHPLLWELILAPFSKNNFPVITLNIISLVIVSISVFLMLRFSPINPVLKLIFLLSNGFFYYNPVIARDYCLIPLGIAFIGMSYKNRHERPFLYGLSLAFLSQTHFLMYGLLAILVLGFLVEEIFSKEKARKTFGNILKVLVPVGVSVGLLLPVIFGVFNNQAIITGVEATSLEGVLRTEFWPAFWIALFGTESGLVITVLITLLVLFIISLLAENLKILAYTIASFGFWFYLMFFVYKSYEVLDYKCTIFALILMLMAWILKHELKQKENIITKIMDLSEIFKFLRIKIGSKGIAVIFIGLIVSMTIPRAIACAAWDVEHPYSPVEEIAEIINDFPEGSVLIEGDGSGYYGISAEVYAKMAKSIKVYNVDLDSYDTYKTTLKYDKTSMEILTEIQRATTEEITNKINKIVDENEHVYLVVSSNRTTCNKNTRTAPTYAEDYEFIGETSVDSYRNTYSPISFYKIK